MPDKFIQFGKIIFCASFQCIHHFLAIKRKEMPVLGICGTVNLLSWGLTSLSGIIFFNLTSDCTFLNIHTNPVSDHLSKLTISINLSTGSIVAPELKFLCRLNIYQNMGKTCPYSGGESLLIVFPS